MSQKFATDYIDVATRIVEFREKYPDGSLQPAVIEKPYSIEEIGGQTYIVVVAAAYRNAEDTRPGIGMAYELFPGKTPYTRGSELQNAETSAWGRAIVAAWLLTRKRASRRLRRCGTARRNVRSRRSRSRRRTRLAPPCWRLFGSSRLPLLRLRDVRRAEPW